MRLIGKTAIIKNENKPTIKDAIEDMSKLREP
jgi:hypothetical protein